MEIPTKEMSVRNSLTIQLLMFLNNLSLLLIKILHLSIQRDQKQSDKLPEVTLIHVDEVVKYLSQF